MIIRVYGIEFYNNLIVNSIGGYNGVVVGVFFEKDLLNVFFIYMYFILWYFWILFF